MTKPRGVGRGRRPESPDGTPRDERLRVSVTRAEKATIEAAAERCERDLSRFVREAALERATKSLADDSV